MRYIYIEREREREINCAHKLNILMSGSPIPNPKSGPDYSVSFRKYFFFILHTPKDVFAYTRVHVPQAEDHCSKPLPLHQPVGHWSMMFCSFTGIEKCYRNVQTS
jgi:hypothetical protein